MKKNKQPRALLGLITFLISLGTRAEFVEIQRFFDQAGEGARVTAISPDEAHFYVMGSSDISAYSLFPAGAVSPRIQLIRGFDGETAIDFSRFAVFGPDGRQLYVSASNEVRTFDRDPATGNLSLAGSLDLPDFDETTTASAGRLDISADGRHLYVLGQAGVTLLELHAQTGLPAVVDRYPMPNTPTPSTGQMFLHNGDMELIAAKRDKVAVFDRNPATGVLAEKQILERGISTSGLPLAALDANTLALGVGTDVRLFRRPDGDSPFASAESFTDPDIPRAFQEFWLSPDGQHLYFRPFGQDDIGRFAVGDNPILAYQGRQDLVAQPNNLNFADGGSRVLVASPDTDSWALLDREPDGVLSLSPDQVYDGAPDGTEGLGGPALTLSPMGDVLVANAIRDESIGVFDVIPDGRLVLRHSLPYPGGSAEFSVAFGADNNRFYTLNLDSFALDIWEKDTGTDQWNSRPGTPPGLVGGGSLGPWYMTISDDDRFLYVSFSDFGNNDGNDGIQVFAIEASGDLTAVQTLKLTERFLFPFNLLFSSDGSYLYSFNSSGTFGVNVTRRNPADGTLELVHLWESGQLALGGVTLPGNRLLVSDRGVPGLVLLGHGPDDRLSIQRRFVEDDTHTTLGLGALGYNLLHIPGTRRYLHLNLSESSRHALLELDSADQLTYLGAVERPAFRSAFSAVTSGDGRILYVAAGTLNAITVHRVDGLFSGGFERSIIEIEPMPGSGR